MKNNLKVALVTAYPPSKTTLNEYGYHLAKHLAVKSEVSELCILTETTEDSYQSDNSKISFHPCWSFNNLWNVFNILKRIKKLKPNAVIINLQFLLFGDKKLPAAIGLLLPLFLKIYGFKSVVLLHNIMEEVDLEKAGITSNKLSKWIYEQIGQILTRFILVADIVGVTIDQYVDILTKKYKKNNIVLLPHGAFEIPPKPNFEKTYDKQRIMTFGKFGTYKKVEVLIDAFIKLQEKGIKDLELVIAGTDNPNAKGYLDGVANQYKEVSGLKFTGYVAEEDVPTLFTNSSVVVFPYTSTTGSSGVLHQTGSYGKAAVLPNLGDLGKLVKEEGYAGEFFEPNDPDSLTETIENLLTNHQHRQKVAIQNYEAASSLALSDISDWYLIHISNLTNSK